LTAFDWYDPQGEQVMTSSEKSMERPHDSRTQTVCLLILTALGIGGALYALSSVLIPFVLAIFLTLCLTPVVDVQVRWLRIPPRTALVTAALLGFVALLLAGVLVSMAIAQIAENRKQYQAEIRRLGDRVQAMLPEDWVTEAPEGTSQPLFGVPADAVQKVLGGIVSSVMTVVSNGLLVGVFMVFLIAGMSLHRPSPDSVWHEVESRTKRYLLTLLLTSSVTGVLVGIVLTVLGVRFAWMFGFLAFLLNFIPSIGSIIATLLPLPVALLDPQMGLVTKLLVLLIPGAIQFTVGNLIQPRVMGQSLNLHPVVVLLSLIFFGTIWGIVGMFLATPITAVVRILLERFDDTRPVALVLAGNVDALTGPAGKQKQRDAVARSPSG